ncbi:MAG: oligosaccharide flippase family protein, partial [Moritella sp.]|uniref:oligosaccharide flippase family protein n=1 Tax=Moritella sp. TaxID=78556 RepID=UPI001E14AC91
KNFRTMMKFTLILTFPLFTGLLLIAPEIVEVIFGNKWLESVVYIQLISIIVLVRMLFSFHTAMFLILDVPNIVTKKLIVSAISCLSLVFIFGARYQAGAAVGAFGLFSVLFLLWNYQASSKVFNYTPYDLLTDARSAIISTLAMSVGVLSIKFSGIVDGTLLLVMLVVSGTFCYLCSILFLERSALSLLLSNYRNMKNRIL